MHTKEYSLEIGAELLVAQFNNLADQADGSCMVSYGGTTVLATAVMSEHEKEGSDFFPLTVDYEERFYAIGKILGSQFVHREGKPSEEAILAGRIVDRTIRPLFAQYIRHEVQVVVTVLALDKQDPDTLAVLAASLALGTSNIPWNGPVSAVRIFGKKGNSEQIVNPSYEIRKSPDINFDLIACGKDGNINMIEVGGYEASEKTMIEALERASQEIEKIQKFQQKIIAEIGKAKRVVNEPKLADEVLALFTGKIEKDLDAAIFSATKSSGIKTGEHDIAKKWRELVQERFPEADTALTHNYLEEKINDLIHTEAIERGRRPDGRAVDEVRPIFAAAGSISPVLHGTGVFFRGETHVLGVLTLGGPKDALTVDGIESQESKRFMLHYNFPPYSTGETGRMGGTNRRMIGHGALAEKALLPIIPAKEKFPYTIRIVAEAMASNGSTSMGSVCAGTVALMDGGVPILRPVAGIASGLMMQGKKYVVLTDIQGPEDHHGDMDFKVAGTTEGITAVQMDVKVDGIPVTVLAEAFEKAKAARRHILGEIAKAIAAPRPKISPRAPHIISVLIKPDQIGLVIGGGGKTINDIIERTGADINIDDDGTVSIVGTDEATEKAATIIREMTKEYVKGERLTGEITKITEFGAFVRISSTVEGLVHVSEIAPFRIDRVEKYLKLGQKIPVIIKGVDEKGRVSLSIKQADPNFIKPLVTINLTNTPINGPGQSTKPTAV